MSGMPDAGSGFGGLFEIGESSHSDTDPAGSGVFEGKLGRAFENFIPRFVFSLNAKDNVTTASAQSMKPQTLRMVPFVIAHQRFVRESIFTHLNRIPGDLHRQDVVDLAGRVGADVDSLEDALGFYFTGSSRVGEEGAGVFFG